MLSFVTMWNAKERHLHGGVIFSTSMAFCSFPFFLYYSWVLFYGAVWCRSKSWPADYSLLLYTRKAGSLLTALTYTRIFIKYFKICLKSFKCHRRTRLQSQHKQSSLIKWHLADSSPLQPMSHVILEQ